jgi:hypothetical protein
LVINANKYKYLEKLKFFLIMIQCHQYQELN